MLRILPEVVEPDVWTLAFHRTSPYWWVRLLAFGRYKHVSAFAYLPALRLWLVFDVTLAGIRLVHLPDGEAAHRRLAELTADADLVQIYRSLNQPITIRPVFGRYSAVRRLAEIVTSLAPFYCVPAIKHLIGLRSGALRPGSLYRHCLAHGGTPYGTARASVAHDQPADQPAAGDGQGGPHRGDPGPALG